MNKKVGSDLVFYYERFFPINNFVSSKDRKTFFVTLSIGANVGNSIRRFKKLINTLNSNPNIKIISTSPILKNPPFGYLEQEYFYNATINLATTLDVRAFFKYTKSLENRFKRVRTFKNGPRTLDIDIIFFDNLNYKSKDLTIPHYDWINRVSVIMPMIYTKGV